MPALDPYGVRQKRPANAGNDATIPTQRQPPDEPPAYEPAPFSREVQVRQPGGGGTAVRLSARDQALRAVNRLAELAAATLATVWLAVAAFTRPAAGDEPHRVALVVARARPDLPAPDGP